MSERLGVSGRITALLLLAVVWGCAQTEVPPPQAIVSPMVSEMRPAKPPDCPMPVLNALPTAGYKQIALVDAWGEEKVTDAGLVEIIKRKACAAGADAVVITSDHSQEEGKLLPGYAPGPHTQVGGEQSGANVSFREHQPEVGEVGHAGHYMNGIAIIYTAGQSAQRTNSDVN